MAAVSRLLIVLVALTLATAAGPTVALQPPPDLDSLVKKVRESIRREYAEPVRFNYIEEGRDVDVSMFGKVSVGPLMTFEVRQNPLWDKWKRLIAIDGKPLDPAELARRDAEHERHVRKWRERERSETPRQRAARLKEETEEIQERDAILDDAARVFAFSYVDRQTVDGQPLIVVDLTPRPNAPVTTSEGQRMKKFAGRLWVSEPDYHLARVRLHAVDSVSVGWGAVARVDRGSGFEFVRKKVAGEWVAASLTIEGSGNTLLFRDFKIKTVTTYTGHRPSAPVN
jgi:hypothetical protein